MEAQELANLVAAMLPKAQILRLIKVLNADEDSKEAAALLEKAYSNWTDESEIGELK